MRILIAGAGAVGSLFAGYLSVKNDVILYDYRPERADFINKNGIKIEEPDGEMAEFFTHAESKVSDIDKPDMVLIAVKSYSTGECIKSLKPAISKDTTVISLQNGYGNQTTIEKHIQRSPIVIGTTTEAVTALGTGYIRHVKQGEISIGNLRGDKASEVEDIFNNAGFNAAVSADIERIIIKKLFVNIGINALTAITNKTNRAIVEKEDLKILASKLVREAVLVFSESGEKFEADEETENMLSVAGNTGENRSSMLQDMDNNKKTEIDYINGAVVKLAESLGSKAPYNEAITHLVRSLQL